MRNISFALTTDQVLARTKTVTRRLGWKTLRPGTLLQPVRQGMGLKAGQKVEKLGSPIRVVSVRREPLARMLREHNEGLRECALEGFGRGHPKGSPLEFVRFFCETHACQPEDEVTRIEFEYTEAPARPSLTFIINGSPTPFEVDLDKPLLEFVAAVLGATGNTGRPPDEWEVRNINGARR